MLNHLSTHRHAVNLHLAAASIKLGDHDRRIARHVDSRRQKLVKFRLTVHHLHGRAGEDVRRANEQRVADAVAKGGALVHRRRFEPCRLWYVRLVQDGRELVAVLGSVNAQRRRAGDADTRVVQRQRQVVRSLTAKGDKDAKGWIFQLDNVQDAFDRQLVKVQAVRLVKVGGDGLWVVVDDNRRVASGTQRTRRTHGRIVKLDRRPNAVRARPKDDARLTVARPRNVVRRTCIVTEVQVVGGSSNLASQRVDALHKRHDACLLAQRARVLDAKQLANSNVRKAKLLRAAEQRDGDACGRVGR
mmetsp:Transcript_11341/g.36015  ORF Transcript_11341/g.36015 Transcript_11341/m.36015 type:complete len:302 (+) Transcript_11341:945-1850(+)